MCVCNIVSKKRFSVFFHVVIYKQTVPYPITKMAMSTFDTNEVDAVHKDDAAGVLATTENADWKSAMLTVSTLEKEYDAVLRQYQEALQNYIVLLEQPAGEQGDGGSAFVALPVRAWWGSAGLKEGDVASQQECESMCASDLKCTGATFDPQTKHCWARTGRGTLSVSPRHQVALLPKQTAAIHALKVLNDQLMRLNEKITEALEEMQDEANDMNVEKEQRRIALQENRAKLQAQNADIYRQLLAYETFAANNAEKKLAAEQQNGLLYVWLVVVIIVALVTMRQLAGGGGGQGAAIAIVILFVLGWLWWRRWSI